MNCLDIKHVTQNHKENIGNMLFMILHCQMSKPLMQQTKQHTKICNITIFSTEIKRKHKLAVALHDFACRKPEF